MQVEILRGEQLRKYLNEIAELRIQLFRSFPYLYEGDIDYEKQYLEGLSNSKESLLCTILEDGKVQGCFTSLPLSSDGDITDKLSEQFKKNKLDIKNYYYLSECLVLPNSRRRNLSSIMHQNLINEAKKLDYSKFCLATVRRDDNHPLKPKNYFNNEYIWQKWGYNKTNITFTFPWPTIQHDHTVINQENLMDIWINENS